MAWLGLVRRSLAILGACAAVLYAGWGSARASVIESTPTLPLLGVPYITPGGNCFPTAQFCVTSGAFTLTSIVPGGFVQSGSGELITTNASATIELTNLSNVPIGTVTLTGTIEQEVVGRLNSMDTGSWTVDLLSMSLSGTLDGDPVTMTLNPADTSSGTTSIIPAGGTDFIVNSFFDVFTELTYDTPGGVLTATPSGIATATAVPEPASFALLGTALVGFGAIRRRRKRVRLT